MLVLVFFTILLILGFGFQAWNLSAIVVMLTVGMATMMGLTDIQAIMNDWTNRRCDIDIMFSAFLYKPYDDPRSTSEFAGDNFTFCVKTIFNEGIKILVTPVLAILGKQLDVTDVLKEIFNILRTIKANAMASFMKILDPVWKRFAKTALLFSQNFQRMLSAMSRVGAIALATLYMGMGIQIAIQNTIDFVVKVVIIIMNILVALVAILFLILWPLIPFVILPTIDMLEAAGFGDRLGGLRSGFCFDPSTLITLKTSERVPIGSLKAGDRLWDGSEVEGVLIVDGSLELLYSIDSILVSGDHLLYDERSKEWIPVLHHPSAKHVSYRSKTLVCLRTTNREINLRGSKSMWKFRDWEELPSGYDAEWEMIIHHLLNKEIKKTEKAPSDYPMIGASCEILHGTGEKRPISSVKIGDLIFGDSGATRVTGIYKGTLVPEDSFTDGVWIKKEKWEHLEPSGRGSLKPGYHLTTESGTFWVDTKEFSGFVRDFTEVGVERLSLTYPFVQAILSIKKSTAKEENNASRISYHGTCHTSIGEHLNGLL